MSYGLGIRVWGSGGKAQGLKDFSFGFFEGVGCKLKDNRAAPVVVRVGQPLCSELLEDKYHCYYMITVITNVMFTSLVTVMVTTITIIIITLGGIHAHRNAKVFGACG